MAGIEVLVWIAIALLLNVPRVKFESSNKTATTTATTTTTMPTTMPFTPGRETWLGPRAICAKQMFHPQVAPF